MEKSSVLDGRSAGAVHLVGGRLCLDFVNSVGARRVSPSGKMTIRAEKLGDYLDLLAWARNAEVLTASGAERLARKSTRREKESTTVFRRAARLRDALDYMFSAVDV